MTEEEKKLAREYAEKFGDDNILHFGELLIDLSPIRKESFIAGLEAGRPKWHKVADGDLPNENKRYFCKIKEFVGSGISYECFDYDTEYSSWKNACGDVIAWCEIPKYTEE